MTKKEHHKVNELDNPPRRQRHIHGVDILTHETKKKLKGDAKSIGKNYGKDMEMVDDIKSKNITKDVKKEICLL